MTIKLYITTKRRNSTATPTSKPAMFTLKGTKTVNLKDESNVLAPSFLLNAGGHDGSNYVEAFGRFYWVKDVVIVRNNLIQLNCVIDVLGSYRGHIQNTSAFVLYDSTANSEIPDGRLGIKTTPTISTSQASMPWGFVIGTGSNFICVSGNGKNTDSAGSTGVYQITQAGLSDLGFQAEDLEEAFDDMSTAYNANYTVWMNQAQTEADGILSDPTRMVPHAIMTVFYMIKALTGAIKTFWIDGLVNVWKSVVKLFNGGDALKNVRAAYWLPFTVANTTTPYAKLALGGYVETITGGVNKVTDPIQATTVSVSIPWQFSDWRNVSCTEIQLYIPLIGNISIPSSAVRSQGNITVYCSLNLYSGLFSVRLTCGGATLGTFGADCRMPIMVGDSNVNGAAIMNTIAAGAAAIASGGASVATQAALLGAAAASGAESLKPVNTTVGGIGGGAGSSLGANIICATICHGTSQNPATLLPVIGTPTNELKTLSSITGYCQTLNAHMSQTPVTGESYPTEGETEEADRLMNSGIYLE